MLIGVAFWDKLPDEMVSHIGVSGSPDAMSSKTTMVFGLPLVMLAVHLLS